MGAAIIALPIMTLVIPIEVGIPVSCIGGFFMAFYLIIRYFKFANYKYFIPMAIGGIPGAFIGVYLLVLIPKNILQFILGAFLLFYCYWQFTLKEVKPHPTTTLSCFLVGGVSGIVNASTSIGGPPLFAYSLYHAWERRLAIATLSSYHVIMSMFAIPGQYFMGFYTEDTLYFAAISIFGMIFGIILGTPLAKRISAENYRTLLLAIIFLAGLLCLVKGIFV